MKSRGTKPLKQNEILFLKYFIILKTQENTMGMGHKKHNGRASKMLLDSEGEDFHHQRG